MRHDYARDVGNLHVIDYYLHHGCHIQADLYRSNLTWSQAARMCYVPCDRFDPEDWTRYDGELL
jgi:hypothetical protein